MNDSKPPMLDYFDAKDKGKDWHIYCKVCGKGWALAKASNHPGNTLHLINHALSHAKTRKAEGGAA